MNPENGGQSSKLQQQTAAAMARRKVLASYTSNAQKSIINSQNQQRVATQTTNTDHLKDQQAMPKVSPESWKQYHTAWQDYYQKYYSNYYSNAAKNYIAKVRSEDALAQSQLQSQTQSQSQSQQPQTQIQAQAPTQTPQSAFAQARKEQEEEAAASLKTKIHAKAAKKVKKGRHHHLIPIFVGVFVTLLILFLQYNRLIFAPIMAYVSPGNAPASEIESIDPTVTRVISPDPKILIPKLNVDVPVHFGINASDAMSAMNNGVAHYRIAGADAYPGQIGNLVITGHSAGDIYSSNPYKYIFSGLERLENGDHIYINYNSVRYTYSVTKKEVIEPTNVAALIIDTDKPMLTLVTCTPLGTSRYRLLVFAEQISPAYNEEEDNQTTPTDYDTQPEELPSNEPSFFEGVWNWLTGR